MEIQCPSCAALYDVPDARLTRRAVQCARCGAQWTPVAVVNATAPAPAHPIFDAPPPVDDPPPPPPPPAAAPPLPTPSRQGITAPAPRSKALIVAWVASFALLGALAAGAVAKRESVMQAWPPSQRVYGALGLR